MALASLPYENATSGKAAVDDMQKLLRGFGASSFGCMEDFDKGEVIVQFQWRGRRVTIQASSKGYAAAWLRRHPYSFRSRGTKLDHERKALKIGQTAVYSMDCGSATTATIRLAAILNTCSWAPTLIMPPTW